MIESDKNGDAGRRLHLRVQLSIVRCTDSRTLKDKTGKAFGEENFKAAVDGKMTEVSYMFPRPGETEPAQKFSFVTGVSDLGCDVGYFK